VAYYTQPNGTKVAAAVYYGATIAAAYKDLYYFFGDYVSARFDAAVGDYVYKVKMYVNGEPQEIEVKSAAPASKFYGSYTLDPNGYYSFTDASPATQDWDAITNKKGWFDSVTIDSLFENYLTFDSYDGFVTDDTKVIAAGSVAGKYNIESVADLFAIKADAVADGKTATITASISTSATGSIVAIYVEKVDLADD
jgi:hypothetical protein